MICEFLEIRGVSEPPRLPSYGPAETSPVSGIAACNNLPINIQNSVDNFHHQRRNLRHNIDKKQSLSWVGSSWTVSEIN